MQFGHPNPVKKLQREFEKVALTPGAGLCAQASQEWPCWGGNCLSPWAKLLVSWSRCGQLSVSQPRSPGSSALLPKVLCQHLLVSPDMT